MIRTMTSRSGVGDVDKFAGIYWLGFMIKRQVQWSELGVYEAGAGGAEGVQRARKDPLQMAWICTFKAAELLQSINIHE